jgi:hypothetical protein
MRSAVLLLLVGCGGIAFEDYAQEVDDARCEYLVRCHVVATAPDCHASLEQSVIVSPSLPTAIQGGIVQYDEDAAQSCVDALAGLSCDLAEQVDALAPCDDVYAGTLDDGAACGFDLECVSGRCATPACEEACCIGMCLPATALPDIDEACSTFCVDGAYCGADSLCHASLPKGAACDATTICVYGLYCAGASQGGSGVCSNLPREGESCEGPCAEEGLRCLSGACQPVGLAGDPCDTDGDCSPFYSCNPDRLCGRYPTLGMPCLGRCSGDAYCESAVCVEQKPPGAGCTYNIECTTHFCGDGDVCGDPPLCI